MALKLTQDAKVIQVLLWYEKPEIILLEGPKLIYTLAVRSGDLKSDEFTYVGGSMTAKRLRDYANGKCDLRFAIAHANTRNFWKFSMEPGQEAVRMRHITRSDGELALSLPDSGVFSRDHDDIAVIKSKLPDSIEKFSIDGGWDLGEFSQFYAQVEDVYYIMADIDRFDDPEIPIEERTVISNAFDRSWDGGGSYVAFYKDVANDNDFHAPLRVSGIQYNSPGHVTIFAQREAFDNLMSIVNHYALNEEACKRAYNALSSFMAYNKLKKRGAAQGYVTEAVRTNVEELSYDLEAHLPGVSFAALMSMTGGNVVVAAKVLASIFRRVKRLYQFFDEGRVSHPQIEIN